MPHHQFSLLAAHGASTYPLSDNIRDRDILIAEIRIAGHRRLSVCARSDGGTTMRLETDTATGKERFDMQLPLAHLPELIDALVEIEQEALDAGRLPERDEEADGGAA